MLRYYLRGVDWVKGWRFWEVACLQEARWENMAGRKEVYSREVFVFVFVFACRRLAS